MIHSLDQALKTRLNSASSGGLLGYTLGTIASVPTVRGQLAALAQTPPSLPGCWLCISDIIAQEGSHNGKWPLRVTLSILCAAPTLDDQADQPGSLTIAQDLLALLSGQSLGLAGVFTPLTPVSLSPVTVTPANGSALSVWLLTLTTRLTLSAHPDALSPDLPALSALPATTGATSAARLEAALTQGAIITGPNTVSLQWDTGTTSVPYTDTLTV